MLPLLALAACLNAPPKDTGEPPVDTDQGVDTGESAADTGEPTVDADADGFSPPEDCDDARPDVHPQAPEALDSLDNDCDDAVDEVPWSGDQDVDREGAVLEGDSGTTMYLGRAVARSWGDALDATLPGDGPGPTDGVADVLVSGTGDSGGMDNQVRGVWLVGGRPGPDFNREVGQIAGMRFLPAEDRVFFGETVDFVDDLDGDGASEVLVGAPGYGWNPDTTGAAFLFSSDRWDTGEATTADATLTLLPETPWYDAMGFVTGLGDVDGDGLGEMAVGDPAGGDWNGRIYFFLSPETLSGQVEAAAVASFALTGGSTLTDVGWSRPAVGDLDADGHPDVVVGHPYTRDGFGLLRWHPGTDAWPARDTSIDDFGQEIDCRDAWPHVGGALVADQDFDGDGRADLAVQSGLQREDLLLDDQVGVQVLSGADLVASGDVMASVVASVEGFRLPAANDTLVFDATDLNADGFADLVVTDPNAEATPTSGYVAVFYGRPEAWTADARDPDGGFQGSDYGELGTFALAAQDVTGDGLEDLLLGSHTWNGDGMGALFVVPGPTPGSW